jgi:UDP-N-acetylglucosamine transferase subunit ALG13
MITVTLGTIPYPFDRSIHWLKTLLDRGIINEPVFIQYGTSDVSDLLDHPLVTAAAVVPQAELQALVNRSRLVISHGGQGSTRLLAAAQVNFVLLPRLAAHGEHVDDHQLMFARSVEAKGVHHCVSLAALEQAILRPPALCASNLFDGPKLSAHLLRRYPVAQSRTAVRLPLQPAMS